jgi:hypothetical protein
VSFIQPNVTGKGGAPRPLLDEYFNEEELIDELTRKLKKGPKHKKGWKRKLWGWRRKRIGPPATQFEREWLYRKEGVADWLRGREQKMPRAKSRSA